MNRPLEPEEWDAMSLENRTNVLAEHCNILSAGINHLVDQQRELNDLIVNQLERLKKIHDLVVEQEFDGLYYTVKDGKLQTRGGHDD